MKEIYKVKAKIERDGIEPFWMKVGVATKLDDGRVMLTLDALPLHSKGVFVLYPVTRKEGKEDESIF